MEFDIVQDAVYNLYQCDFLSPFNNEITDLGNEYLNKKTIDSFEKEEATIYVNAFTGNIEKYSNSYMDKKEASAFLTYKGIIKEVTYKMINFQEMQQVFADFCESREINKNCNLVDVINLNKKSTKYKRLHVLIYQNIKEEIRILTIEDGKKTDKYEKILLELDKNGQNLMKFKSPEYFKAEDVIDIFSKVKKDTVNESVNFLSIFEKFQYVTIILPLIENDIITSNFLNLLETKVSKKHIIKVIVCGTKYVDYSQENFFGRLLKLQKKFNFSCVHITQILPTMCFDNDIVCVIISSINDLNLSTTTKGIMSYSQLLNKEDIIFIKQSIDKYLTNDIDFNKIEVNIKEKIEVIEKLLLDVNSILVNRYNLEPIYPSGLIDKQNFLLMPIALTKQNFETFLNILSKSIVEPIRTCAASHGKKDFFWNELKSDYPELQKQLDKIRVFRNKADHVNLDSSNEKLYYEYLKEDNNGHLLEFTIDGYKNLQAMWISNMELILRKIVENS